MHVIGMTISMEMSQENCVLIFIRAFPGLDLGKL